METLIASVFVYVSNAAISMGMEKPVWVPAFNSLGHVPRNGMDESYGNFIF